MAVGGRACRGTRARHVGQVRHDQSKHTGCTGASRWAICLGRPIQHILEEPPPDLDVQMGDMYGDVGPSTAGHGLLEMAAELWEIVLKTEDGAQALLKDKYRAAKERRSERHASGRNMRAKVRVVSFILFNLFRRCINCGPGMAAGVHVGAVRWTCCALQAPL